MGHWGGGEAPNEKANELKRSLIPYERVYSKIYNTPSTHGGACHALGVKVGGNNPPAPVVSVDIRPSGVDARLLRVLIVCLDAAIFKV